MFAVLFLTSVFFNGVLLVKYFFPKEKNIGALSFFIGSVVSVTFVFLLLSVFHSLQIALAIYFAACFLPIIKGGLREVRGLVKKKEVLIYGVVFCLTFLLFEKSFSYSDSSFLIQSNLYQDYGAHIPIIRYFSNGTNYIPEVPFFGGKNLLYHFMFDFYAAILEFLGMRIDVALNVLSAITLTSLFSMIVVISRQIFKNSYVGIVACALLVLNSDLSFIGILSKNGVSLYGLISIYHHNTYLVGSLFGLDMKANFLTINTYLNQRQLIFGMLSVVAIVYLLIVNKLSSRQISFVALTIGVLPFWHIPALVAIYIILGGIFIFFKEKRKEVLKIVILSLILVIPQVLLIKQNSVNLMLFNPGFLVAKNLSLKSFIVFWVWNLGFLIPLCIYAFIKSDNNQRKIFLIFLPLFIIPNLLQFSRDIFDNHKFFNVLIIFLDIYAAYGFFELLKQKMSVRIVAFLLLFLATLSGALNLLVVKNDVYAKIPDAKNIGLVEFLNKDHSVLFTNGEIYDPLSIAGFRTFLGRSQYIFLYGGDPNTRIVQKQIVFEGEKRSEIKRILKQNKIHYIIVYKNKLVPNLFPVDIKNLNKNYKQVYEDDFGIIYKN